MLDLVCRSVRLLLWPPAWSLLFALSIPLSAEASMQRQSPVSSTSVSDVDFGLPEFRHSESTRRIIDGIHEQETRMLEKAQWHSMDTAIFNALANNPELAAAYEEIAGKKWTVIAARRRWSPTVTIEPTQSASLQFNVRNPPASSVDSTSSSSSSSTSTSGPPKSLSW